RTERRLWAQAPVALPRGPPLTIDWAIPFGASSASGGRSCHRRSSARVAGSPASLAAANLPRRRPVRRERRSRGAAPLKRPGPGDEVNVVTPWWMIGCAVGAGAMLLAWARVRAVSRHRIEEALPECRIAELEPGRFRVIGRV